MRSLPVPIALLCWTLAGFALLVAAGIGTSSLQPDLEESRLLLAFVAGVLVLLATGLVVVALRPLASRLTKDSHRVEPPRVLGVVGTTGLLLATYFFVAVAPGGLPFDDSRAEGIAATLGLWLGLTSLALLDERLCRGVAAAACIALMLGSLAVTLSAG